MSSFSYTLKSLKWGAKVWQYFLVNKPILSNFFINIVAGLVIRLLICFVNTL